MSKITFSHGKRKLIIIIIIQLLLFFPIIRVIALSVFFFTPFVQMSDAPYNYNYFKVLVYNRNQINAVLYRQNSKNGQLDTNKLVSSLTNGTKKTIVNNYNNLNQFENSTVYIYSISRLQNGSVYVKFRVGTESFIYEIRNSIIYPIARKTFGITQYVIILLLSICVEFLFFPLLRRLVSIVKTKDDP